MAHQRRHGTALGRNRRRTRLCPRHNGVDRVGGQPRQHEPGTGTELHQGVVARIRGAAASGDKPGAQQLATARQIDDRPRLHGHRLAAQNHADAQVAVGIDQPTLTEKGHGLAVIGVDLPVQGAAIGQHQPLAAHRRHAARQQLHLAAAHAADIDQAQRRAHHAALLDGGGAQLQAPERRIRQRRIRAADAAKGQAAQRIKVQALGNGAGLTEVAGNHPGTDVRGGVHLRRAQGHVALGQQLGADAGDDVVHGSPRQKAQVALAGQVDLVEATALKAGLAGVGAVQAAAVTEDHIATHFDQLPLGVELRLSGTLGRHRQHRHRTHVEILAALGGRQIARQQQVRRRQVDACRGGGVVAQAIATAVQTQALAHIQADVAVKAQQTIAQQREVIEAAGLDLIHAQTCVPIVQAIGRRFGRASQSAR